MTLFRKEDEDFERSPDEDASTTAEFHLTPATGHEAMNKQASDQTPSYTDAVSPALGFSVPEKNESADLPRDAANRDLSKTTNESDSNPSNPPYPVNLSPTAPTATSDIFTSHFPITPTTGGLTDLYSSHTEAGTPQASEKPINDQPYSIKSPK